MKKPLKNNKQLVHKTTKESYISLPEQLVEDIKSLQLQSTQQSHCFKFVGILLRDSFQDFRDLTSPTPKPQTYLIKTFDVYYYKWLNQLLSNNIVIRSDYYSHENNICYKYSVSPIYFSSIKPLYTLCNQKECKPLLTVGYKDIVKNITSEDRKYHNMFSEDILSLNIDYERLLKIVENRVNSLTISEFQINEAIRESVIKIHVPSGKPYYIKTGDAIAKAKSKGKSLINDNGIYRIENEIEFINHKKESINFSYINSIERLKQNNLYAKRNGTNSRLDTNFTSMCSLLVNDICEQNGLVQIDLKNSQFAILSYLLKNELDTDDYKRFKALSVGGKLYDYIANKLGLNERKKAKNTMFEIMFSSQKNSTTGKAKIKELFPTIVKWIDDYKKQNGDNEFAIMLQKKESEIFIDTILKKIKSKKMFCLTKHDSVIVREKDSVKIQVMIQDIFNEIGMEGELEITNPKETIIKNDSLPEVIELKSIKNDGIYHHKTNDKKEKLKERYLSKFKYASNNYVLSPADFHILTENYFLDLLPPIQTYNFSKYCGTDDFDFFWDSIQKLKDIKNQKPA